MTQPISIGALLTPGLRSEFSQVYMPRYAGVEAMLKDVMAFDLGSDKLTEIFGYLEAPTYPVRWDPGQMIGAKSILSKQYTVTNRDFGRRIYIPRNWQDDQSGSVWQIARGLGANWATLAERIFYQYIRDAADPDLLPDAPLSADGADLYSSSTRYGSSSGNIVSVGSTATVQGIITDVYGIIRRLTEFLNTESQPFWGDADIRGGLKIFHGTALTLVMEQAAKQMVIQSKIAGTSTTDVSTSAGASNVLLASGRAIGFVNSVRITDSVYYGFLMGLPNHVRPIFRLVRKGQQEAIGNVTTSDSARDTGEEYVQFDSREGWGSILAIGTCKVA